MPAASVSMYNLRPNLGSPLSACTALRFTVGPIKPFRYAWLKWGQGWGRTMASHCVCVHVWLTGNLEHVIQGVVSLNSACVSGTEVRAAIELLRQDNAALEKCVWSCERETKAERRASDKPPRYWFLFRLVFQEWRHFFLTVSFWSVSAGYSHYCQIYVR